MARCSPTRSCEPCTGWVQLHLLYLLATPWVAIERTLQVFVGSGYTCGTGCSQRTWRKESKVIIRGCMALATALSIYERPEEPPALRPCYLPFASQ